MCDKSNERSEGGRIHVRNISVDEKYPPSMEECKRSVANDREKEREDERKIDEPPKRIFLQLCMDFPVNLDETNSPWNYTWLE